MALIAVYIRIIRCWCQAKRLVLFIDEAYEQRIELEVWSDGCTHPSQLFQAFSTTTPATDGQLDQGPGVHEHGVRPVDESQLSMAVVDTGIANLGIACARASSRLVELCGVQHEHF